MMNSNIDTDISNYSIAELMAISGINSLDPKEITEQTNKLITKLSKSNPNLSVFFMEIQSQLLQYASGITSNDDQVAEGFGNMTPDETNNADARFPAGDQQVNNWYQNEALPQTGESNENQTDKITNRQQKIDVFGNTHVPMNRNQLGVSNNFQVDVAQDSLNPNLKNTITRFVNLDSQFRQYTSNFESSATDYTLDLSDPLTNALSMRLYSYQIPFSWYVIDVSLGNTCFWITQTITDPVTFITTTYNIPITIPPGNYTASQLVDAITKSLGFMTFTFTQIPVTYDVSSGKMTLNLYGGTFSGTTILVDGILVVVPPFTISDTTIITFYDHTAKLQCGIVCVNKSFYLNQTLGWIMGFRVASVNVVDGGNTGTAVVDLTGTKYLILVVDDYNQNHVNNGLVSIAEYSNVLKLPSYYSPDLPYTCVQPTTVNTADIFPSGKSRNEYTKTQILLPSAPRTLTNPQLYTINEINKNRSSNTNYRAKAPTSTDILAIIPIKTSGTSTGTLLVEFSGSLQDNIRTYFGPVNVDRMRIRLLNDKGNTINLNGLEWCVTLICDCLYQY
jgi:hypothetical protein